MTEDRAARLRKLQKWLSHAPSLAARADDVGQVAAGLCEAFEESGITVEVLADDLGALIEGKAP